jgi:DNA-binding beta-propeller fold protein YncE
MRGKAGLFGVGRILALIGVGAIIPACGKGGGGGGGAPPANNVPRFAYVANIGDNTLSIYAVDLGTGQLRHNGYVTNTGTFPDFVTVDPSRRFAYVANGTSNNVSAYTINASTGALTPVAGSPFAAGTGPYSVITVGTIR